MVKSKPGFLLKYVEREFVEGFIERGEIHFSSLDYFINRENETGDSVIGDKFEGARIVNLDVNDTVVKLDEHIFNGKSNGIESISFSYTDDQIRQWGICSMSNIDIFKDCDKVSYDEYSDETKFKLKKSVGEELYRMSNNGKRIPVIIKSSGLINAMNNSFKDGKNHIEMKGVKYYDENVRENISLEDYKNNPINAIFLKRHIYKYQREVRVALIESVPTEGLEIEVGPLSDSMVKIDSHDRLMEVEFRVKGIHSNKELCKD